MVLAAIPKGWFSKEFRVMEGTRLVAEIDIFCHYSKQGLPQQSQGFPESAGIVANWINRSFDSIHSMKRGDK